MKKVAINASGGGTDIGITGNGIVEKEMTLNIANKLKDVLESKGIEVLMLRDGDTTISYDDRIEKLKSFGGPNDVILISNALNSGGETGIEVIYPLSKSNVLASSIADNLEYFNDTKFYQYRWPTDTTKDYYYITRNTPGYETIIVRYGYADNSGDATIIKNDYNAMAQAVADAILDYLGINNEGLYVIKSGDTLYSIASKHNTTVDEIKKLNNLTSNTLTVGNTLKLPTTSSSPTPSTPSISGDTYTIKSGDTLYGIASKYNTTVDEIKKLNNLTSNTLTIGKVLKIPSSDNTPADSSGDTYTIKSGDTLYGIASKYNTTVDEIKKLNNLTSNTLTIGKVLLLPKTNGVTSSTSSTYTVKSGDTLYSIAKQFGLTVDELKSLNNKTNNLISIGEVLKVGNNKTYVVKSGDTLYSIAKNNNTTVDAIKNLNNLKSDVLTIGNILYIP